LIKLIEFIPNNTIKFWQCKYTKATNKMAIYWIIIVVLCCQKGLNNGELIEAIVRYEQELMGKGMRIDKPHIVFK